MNEGTRITIVARREFKIGYKASAIGVRGASYRGRGLPKPRRDSRASRDGALIAH